MPSISEIIERIEKLYALAAGGASEGEAKSAITLAERLMKKYNISSDRVNKHRYGPGASTSHQVPPKRKEPDMGEFWRKKGGESNWGSWYNEPKWNNGTYSGGAGGATGGSYSYRGHTSNIENPTFIRADKIRETAKAYLINVYLDRNYYPWSKLPKIIVSTWIPKSKVTLSMGRAWLVDGDILMSNLKNNRDWLGRNHPVFKGRPVNEIEFHLEEVI